MFRKFCTTASIVLLSGAAWAHDDDASLGGEHALHAPSALELLGQALVPDAEAAATITVRGNTRVISADGLPDHKTGRFPNRNNPNSIRRQNYRFTVPASPRKSGRTTQLVRQPFGVALNGVLFDPGTAEFWNNDPRSGWNYEAIGGPLNLGLDRNNAHVQPNGAYHYHGIPVGLVAHYSSAYAPVLVGYAADGFPIYGPYGYANPDRPGGKLVKLRPSYTLKGGSRRGGPGGRPDGSFTQDYAYAKGSGDLDDCNGRTGVTPEYPKGTYHYVITGSFPFVPRCFKGTADASFQRRAQGPGGRGPDGRGPGGMGPGGMGPGGRPGGPGGRPGFPPPPDGFPPPRP